MLLVDPAFLAWLEIGGQRLAAFLDHAGDVLGELLDIDGAALDRCWRGLTRLSFIVTPPLHVGSLLTLPELDTQDLCRKTWRPIDAPP